MKKIVCKFLLACICLISVICPLCSKIVYADTIAEVRTSTNFKTVEEDGEPEDYDVLIEAKELIRNEQLPNRTTGIEEILYQNKGLIDINFLGNNSDDEDESTGLGTDNVDEHDDFIKPLVRNAYKVILYLSMASMLSVLIYIAFTVVISSIMQKKFSLPLPGRKKANGEESPEEMADAKKKVQKWFGAVIALALSTSVINLIVAFSYNIVGNIAQTNLSDQNIVVYVKDSSFAANAPILSIGKKDPLSGDVGKLRQKVVEQASSLEDLNAINAQEWVASVYEKALGIDVKSDYCCPHQAGINAGYTYSTIDNIVPGAAIFSFSTPNKIIDTVCHMDAGFIGIYIGDNKVASYSGFGDEKIGICSLEEWIDKWGFNRWGWIQGTEKLAKDEALSGDTSQTSQTKKVDYYFTTNVEGLLSFESQYESNSYFTKSAQCVIANFVITVFKIVIYIFVFIPRMFLLAVMTVAAPIVILIDAFKTARDEQGILKKWFKIYIYLIALKPAIALVYYILAESNVYLISQIPMYIVIVIIVIVFLIIKTIKGLFKSIRR